MTGASLDKKLALLFFGLVCVATACGSRSKLRLGAGDAGVTNSSAGAGATISSAGTAAGGGPRVDAGMPVGGAGGVLDAGVMPGCIPGDEICNGIDDDCDGAVDEGLPLDLSDDGAPVTVRSSEGETADCISCAWAWYPKLIPVGKDLGAIWYLGIYGGNEHPSAFGRRLGVFGAVLDEVSSLGDQILLKHLERGPTDDRGTLVTFFERKNQNDTQGFAFVDSNLALGPSTLLPACVWHLGDPSPVLPNLVACLSYYNLELFALDPGGNDIARQSSTPIDLGEQPVILPYGLPVGATAGERRLVVLNPYTEDLEHTHQEFLWSLVIDVAGSPSSAPKLAALPVSTSLTTYALLPSPLEEKFLLFALNRSSTPNLTIAEFEYDGTQLGALTVRDEDLNFVGLDVIPNGEEFLLAGVGYPIDGATEPLAIVERLDATGALIQRWQKSFDVYGAPSIIAHGGSVFALFAHEPVTDEPNALTLYRFGCSQ